MPSSPILLGVPLSAVLRFVVDASPLWVFAVSAVGVAVLAHRFSSATDAIAAKAGPAIGGLLNVSFASIAELVLAVFVVADGEPPWSGRRSRAPSSARGCSGSGSPS